MIKFINLLFLLPNFLIASDFLYGNQVLLENLNELKSKNIALVVNQNSLIGTNHLIDVLVDENLKIKKLFALEHGVRGNYSAGATINDQIDSETGIPIVSLYGNKKAPSDDDLEGIDTIIYDIQDVGVRFYTFIASLGHIMESINDKKIDLIVLDRPNPHNYIDGPVNEFKHFLAPYPIPLVYGLTIGELALMIQGENWLKVEKANLKIVQMKNYKRSSEFEFIKNPSPNLRSMQAIKNYPTLALFEPTNLSIGRGTMNPFMLIGKPNYTLKDISFRPVSIPGMAEKPKFMNEVCYGENVKLSKFDFNLFYTVYFRENIKIISDSFFKYLIGNMETIKLLKAHKSLDNIKKSWKSELNNYRKLRKKYLIYE